MQKLQWKLVKFHLISTDISAKLGTVAIGIRIGIGIGVGSVETILRVIIEPNFIGIGIGSGVGIGVGQWKHTIKVPLKCMVSLVYHFFHFFANSKVALCSLSRSLSVYVNRS